MPDPQRRQALFTFADARGNNPHGTNESAEHESRRRNAGRYETVEQMNARVVNRGPNEIDPVLGTVSPAPNYAGSGLLGIIALLGLAAGIALIASNSRLPAPPEDDVDDDEPPRPNPARALPPAPPVVVVSNPAPVALPVTSAPVIDVVAKPVRSRRRRAKAVTPAIVVVPASTSPSK